MISVLHVFGGLDHGGAETLIMNLYREITKENVEFSFVTHTKEIGKYEDEIIKLGGTIYRAPKYKIVNHFLYRKFWINFFKINQQFDVVHGHMRSTALLYIKIAQANGIKTIIHSHSQSSGSGIKSLVRKILQYPLKKNIGDYLFACSLEAGKWLFGRRRINKDPFTIFPNSISFSKFSSNHEIRNIMRNRYGLNQKIIYGHVGRFVYEKNHHYLLKVFKKIQEIEKNSFLIMIGDGILKSQIKTEVIKYNLENHTLFIEPVDDIEKYMNMFDCSILPSIREGLGMVAIELQAMKIKCVISEGFPEDVMLSSYVKRVNINENISVIADKILEFKNTNINYEPSQKLKNYDVTKSKNMLIELYEVISNE
jgi:glycosyltransferase involved in cell wall biosynthesis